MRRVVPILLGLALGIPAISTGGTTANPEISDPAGDAIVTRTLAGTVPSPAPWADLTSVRFSTTSALRGRTRVVTGFVVTFKTVAAPVQDQGASLTASWTASDNCFGAVSVWRMASGVAPRNEVFFGCTSDDPSSVADDNFTAPVKIAVKGSIVSATIPLSVFAQGLSKGVYKAGTRLHDTYATASIVAGPLPTDLLRVDQAPDGTVAGTLVPGLAEFGRDFVIGSSLRH